MTYEEWLRLVPTEFADDALWRIEAYRLSLFLGELAWHDVTKLLQDRRTIGLADQLLRAAGSIGANIAEGYSRRSGKDQARFYEYALGSARETRTWYFQARFVLSEAVTNHRIHFSTSIIRLLLTTIPIERTHKVAEGSAPYESFIMQLGADIPLS